ncbi:hypothetical protein RJZ56_003914, partial [Blastomyces dermatitidis]
HAPVTKEWMASREVRQENQNFTRAEDASAVPLPGFGAKTMTTPAQPQEHLHHHQGSMCV